MATQKTRRKKKLGRSKFFATRRQALNAFKKDYGIAKSEQPEEVVKPDTNSGVRHGLDSRNIRLYIFRAIKNVFGFTKRAETHLREDKEAFYAGRHGDQDQHFNAGFAGRKLKDHYYFKKKQ